MRITTYKELMRIRREYESKSKARKTANEEDRAAWETLVNDRYVEVYDDLPAATKVVIAAAATVIRLVVPSADLFITGSRIEGTYLDATDNAETARLRAENIYKTGVSDYDIQVENVGNITKSMFPNLGSDIDVSENFGGRKIPIPIPNI